MITAVIVEDEALAAENLERQIKELNKSIEVLCILQSVDESIKWFSTNKHPDIVFMDIHLADGDSFEIFEKVEIISSIIFTTAYDEYALRAFEVNSIDYLLKPIELSSVEKALNKLSRITSVEHINTKILTNLVKSIRAHETSYRNNFLIPHKDKLIPISADDIAYIFSEYKMAKLCCFNGQKYVLDTSLDEMMRQLNPDKFFRANRQYIVAHRAITDLSIWFSGRLAINLSIATNERIIVSRAKSGELKNWFIDNSK